MTEMFQRKKKTGRDYFRVAVSVGLHFFRKETSYGHRGHLRPIRYELLTFVIKTG